MGKRVAIVGASGFLGNYLVRECCEQNWITTAVFNKTHPITKYCATWMNWEEWINSENLSFDLIYYLSAIIPYGSMNDSNEEMLQVNANQVKAVQKKFPNAKFIYTSTVSVYKNQKLTLSEKSDTLPQSEYARTKLIGEEYVKLFKDWSIIRLSSIFGIGMNTSTFIPRCIEQAKNGREILLFGDGSRLQNYIHVTDAAKMCVQIGEQGNCSIYLGVSPKSFTNFEIAESIANYYDVKIKFCELDLSPSWVFDARFTYKQLDFVPRQDLTSHLISMCDEA